MISESMVTVHIDNGPAMPGVLREAQDVRYETTGLPTADPRWEFTDGAGHFHAYSDDKGDQYPTLQTRSEHVDCDGGCGGVCGGEGYSVTHYHCRICQEEIQPGFRPGPHTFPVPGLIEWSLELNGFVRDETVSVRIVKNVGMTYFGIAMVTNRTWSSDGDTSELVLTGPVGRRAA